MVPPRCQLSNSSTPVLPVLLGHAESNIIQMAVYQRPIAISIFPLIAILCATEPATNDSINQTKFATQQSEGMLGGNVTNVHSLSHP